MAKIEFYHVRLTGIKGNKTQTSLHSFKKLSWALEFAETALREGYMGMNHTEVRVYKQFDEGMPEGDPIVSSIMPEGEPIKSDIMPDE